MSLPNELMAVGLLGKGATGYSISRSLRFNSTDSAYLSRTPGSAGNQTTYTFSCWVKRAALSARQMIFSATNGGDADAVYFHEDNTLRFHQKDGLDSSLITTQVFRDASAWYHLLVSVDTTQGTSSNRIKLYVNGNQVTALSTATYPSSSYTGGVNNTVAHNIGRRSSASDNYLSAYLADIHFIDGQALTPSSFGEFDATTGVWNPKAYSGGSYGTNGFRLPFSDNSAATATTLGKDTAGSNNWTPNNLSVTAGAGNDCLVDTPTNGTASSGGDAGGTVVGNYCTGNPLSRRMLAPVVLSNGNLEAFLPSGNNQWYTAQCTIAVSSGKWYFEHYRVSGYTLPGVAATSVNFDGDISVGSVNNSIGMWVNGSLFNNGGGNAYGASNGNGDTIGVALDMDALTITFYINGVSQGVFAGGINPGLSYSPCIGINGSSGNGSLIMNFGQRPFAYAAPANYKSLNTANLPTPTILKGSDYFQTVLYTGNGSTQTISGLAFSPDWVWIKPRSIAEQHELYDVVRGVNKQLYTDYTDAEGSAANGLTSFDSNGFTLGSRIYDNGSGKSYVAWAWDAGSSNATNTSGSITSTVRANASAGFSIVTWTGTGAYGTLGHGLGVAPSMVLIKNRSISEDWVMWFTGLTVNQYFYFNTTDGIRTYAGSWANLPTSTVFSNFTVQNTTNSYVAYCFATVSGYSSFGSYVGNGSSDGVFVYTGFRVKWYLVKQSNASGENWRIIDATRSPYNVAQDRLLANSSAAEGAQPNEVDFLSNGFKFRSSDGAYNGSGATYIYAAFAENPFSISRAR